MEEAFQPEQVSLWLKCFLQLLFTVYLESELCAL